MVTCKRAALAIASLLSVCSVVDAADVTGAVSFVGITPCRIIETRAGRGFSGQAGPPALVANATRTFQITGTVPGLPAQCGIPTTAVAISVNFTVTGFTGAGDIRAFPAGGALPNASILNYQLENIANSTTVPLGPSGGGQLGISVRADAAATELIADVNGYYVPRPQTLESGQTLKGSFAYASTATAAGDFFEVALTFPIPLAAGLAAPAANFIAVGSPSTASCPGTTTNPTATAGNLCVYESSSANRTFVGFAREGTSSLGNTDAFGVGLPFQAVAAGNSRSRGTWAVTAP